jgi:hypothetical protein
MELTEEFGQRTKRKRLQILLLAAAIGLIYAVPNIIYPLDLGSAYKGVALVNSQDEWAYDGFARESAEGRWLLQSQYLYELKATSRPGYITLQPVPFWVLGGLLKASAMNVQTFTVLSKFTFAALLFVAVSWLLRTLKIPSGLVLVGAAAALLMPAVWGSDFLLFDPKATWGWHLVYARPGANVAVLFLVLACVLVLQHISAGKRFFFWAAVIMGSLAIQSYFFVAAAYCSLLLVMSILHFIWGDKRVAREILKVLGLACFASLWTVYNGLRFLLNQSGDSVWASGAMGYRWPHLPIVTLYSVLSIIFLWILLRIRENNAVSFTFWSFITAIPVAHLICLNQQVITGIILEPHHFETIVFPILTWVVVVWVGYQYGGLLRDRYGSIPVKRLLTDRRVLIGLVVTAMILLIPLLVEPHVPRPMGGLVGKVIRGAAIFDRTFVTWLAAVPVLYITVTTWMKSSLKSLIFIGVYLGSIAAMTQVGGYLEARKGFSTILQPYAPAFRWLEENSPEESVILCSPLVGDFLPAYSHNNVYFCDYAVGAPPVEFRRRLVNQLIFSGVDSANLSQALDPSNAHYDPALKFCFFYWREMGEKGGAKYNRSTFIENYSAEDVRALVESYAMQKERWSLDSLTVNRLDYVILGPIEKGFGVYSGSSWRFSKGLDLLGSVDKLYDDGTVEIYQVQRQQHRRTLQTEEK